MYKSVQTSEAQRVSKPEFVFRFQLDGCATAKALYKVNSSKIIRLNPPYSYFLLSFWFVLEIEK